MKKSGRIFDLSEAAEMANPDAKWSVVTSPDGIYFEWNWDGKNYSYSVPADKCDDDFILFKLFDAAITMAKM